MFKLFSLVTEGFKELTISCVDDYNFAEISPNNHKIFKSER